MIRRFGQGHAECRGVVLGSFFPVLVSLPIIMPSGNGARAQQKRERNAKKDKAGAAHSQLKANEAAKSIQCKVCKQAFLCTASAKDLTSHHESKHSKMNFGDCFDQ